MAVKNRPGAARAALGQQEARTRRGAPGRRFVGEGAEQSAKARRDERERVGRMAEIDAAQRRADELGTPVSAILAELVQDSVDLGRSLVSAPFRIVAALRRPRTA
jgi:hypothetical protein